MRGPRTGADRGRFLARVARLMAYGPHYHRDGDRCVSPDGIQRHTTGFVHAMLELTTDRTAKGRPSATTARPSRNGAMGARRIGPDRLRGR